MRQYVFVLMVLLSTILLSIKPDSQRTYASAPDRVPTISTEHGIHIGGTDTPFSTPSSAAVEIRPAAVYTDEPGTSCKTINFEGVGNLSPIPEFDGITSPGWLGIIDADAGGTGNIAFEPSPETIAFWLEGDPSARGIEFSEAVSEVTFQYASYVTVKLEAFDGDGKSLGTATGPANWNQGPGGDPEGTYNKWDPITLKADTNVIRSIKVIGNENNTGIDNLKVCTKIGINSVEFTQAIQEYQTLEAFTGDIAADKTPPVPLIANKPLALRVYMEEVDTSTDVTVRLSGVATSEQKVTLQPNCSPEESRAWSKGCKSIDFYFTPPDGDWTATLKTLDQGGNEIQSLSFPLTSVRTDPIVLRSVSVCDSQKLDDSGEWLCADSAVLGGLVSFLERTAPTHDVQVEYPGHVVRRNFLDYTGRDLTWWIDIARDIQDLGPESYYYGMVRPEVDSSVGGIAHDIPSRGAASRTSVTRLGVQANAEVVGHETGHMLGRRHTNTSLPEGTSSPGCYSRASDASTDWPYVNNRIQSGPAANPRLEVGFDVVNRRPIDPQNTYDWMSYCVPRWITPFTYRNALTTLRAGLVANTEHESFESASFWRVSGVMEDETWLDPVFTVVTTATTAAGTGTHRIEVQQGNSVLFTRYFTPQALHTESGNPIDDIEALVFSELVPVQPNATQIIVIDDANAIVAAVALAGVQPTIDITYPRGGEFLDEVETVRWSIYDPDSSAFTSWVQYSPDNGTTWQTFASALSGASLDVNFQDVAGSDGDALIRVLVSDGAHTGVATSGSLTVPKKSVVVSIQFPADGSTYKAGELVSLQAITFDPEDGADSNLTWTSSLDGPLGTDDFLPKTNLSPGTHVITVTADDSDGTSATDTITIHVDAQAPTLNLNISPDGMPASCVDVTINADDPATGTGLSTVEYSFDGGTLWTPIELNNLPLSFRVPGKGFIHLVVRAMDKAGNQSVADGRFFIETECPNQAPVAEAGDNYPGAEGSPVALDATQSTDPDGSIILYEWDLDSDGQFDDAIGAKPNTTFFDNGTYTVMLRVTDFIGAVAIDSAQVSIINVPPSVAGGNDQTIIKGNPVDLDLVSYDDPGSLDTHTATVDWGDGRPPAPVIAANGAITGAHVYDDPGQYGVEVCVKDDDNGSSCDTFTVTVELPVLKLLLPMVVR